MTDAPTPDEARPDAAPTAVDKHQNRRLDRAFIFSALALAVSLVGTTVAVVEAYFTRDQAQTLREQQDILLEQRAASAWPLVEWRPRSDGTDPEYVEITFDVLNKGLGPAILGDVGYYVGDVPVESYTIDDSTRAHWPEFAINTWQNTQLDSLVLAPEESIRLATFRVYRGGQNAPITAADSLYYYIEAFKNELVRLDFCYCSVYGRCWRFDGRPQPRRNPACEERFAEAQ